MLLVPGGDKGVGRHVGLCRIGARGGGSLFLTHMFINRNGHQVYRMSQSRAARQWKKFEDEERHFNFLAARGLSSVAIADQLIHYMLDVLETGVRNQHPEWTEEEIKHHLRELIVNDEKLKRQGYGRRNGRA